MLVELPRPALADRDDLDSLSEAQQRAYVRSLEREGTALRSALGARGVELRDAVPFGRTWDGFAATVDSSDLAALSSLGVRALPVRRFYPATSEPVPVRGAPKPRRPRCPTRTTRSRSSTPARRRPATTPSTATTTRAAGADVRSPSRRETTGDALAADRHGGGRADADDPRRRLRPEPAGDPRDDRHAARRASSARSTPTATARSTTRSGSRWSASTRPTRRSPTRPRRRRCAGAGKLGTLVVAPAGNEGPARPPNGVVGSPAAARTALAAGATEAGAGAPRVDVTIGGRELQGAAVLGGAPPPGTAQLAGPVTSTDAAALLRGSPSLGGRVALVRAGENPTAQAAAAAGAGASAVLLADPRDRPLPMLPAGRAAAPVIGLTGEAAKAALEAKAGREGVVRPRGDRAREGRPPRPSPRRSPPAAPPSTARRSPTPSPRAPP